MKPIINYLNCIFASHKYLIFSIPLIALVLYGIGLFFFSREIWDLLKNSPAKLDDNALISISNIGFMKWTVSLVIILPFLHLLFIPNLFYKTYDFTLPISAGQKLASYIIITLIIALYNSLFILLMNFSIEAILKTLYLNDILEAFDRKGLLYTEISKYSVFHNSKWTLVFFTKLYLIFLFFPFCLFAGLYFRKYSLLISAAFIVFGAIIGVTIRSLIWNGYSERITNQFYIDFYDWGPLLLATILCYIGFYYFLKEKEV